MRAIVFANGHISEYGWLNDLRQDGDLLIGANGGSGHCLELGWTPDVVVGDLDSLDRNTLAALHERGVHVEKHPADKDQTDLELALEHAVTWGVQEILIVGALGGRLDQMIANLLILAQRQWPVRVKVIDNLQTAQLLRGGEEITLSGWPRRTVSAIPLSASVTGINYHGLRYPLQNATLNLGSTRAISNEMKADTATISIDTGLLLVLTGDG